MRKFVAAVVVSCLCSLAIAVPTDFEITNVTVLDGDTVRADVILGLGVILTAQNIRMAGINAPEIHSRKPLEKTVGLAVKDWLAARIAQAKKIEIRKAKKDKFYRIRAELYLDGASICDEMLKLGYAVPYNGGKRLPWENSLLQTISDRLAGKTP